MADKLIPLRGRVALKDLTPIRTGLIWHPDQSSDLSRAEDKSYGNLAGSSHRGLVLGFGPPALRHGHEVPHGFVVGDEVVFVYASGMVEKGRRSFFNEEPCIWITQEEVIAVVSGSFYAFMRCLACRRAFEYSSQAGCSKETLENEFAIARMYHARECVDALFDGPHFKTAGEGP